MNGATGADIVCESTHKNGGAIQGSALLLWRETAKFESRALFEAHVKVETTSPNFNIFASIDAAMLRLVMEPELIDDLIFLISDIKVSRIAVCILTILYYHKWDVCIGRAKRR